MDKVEKFKSIRMKLIRKLDDFPKSRIDEIIFDKWSLKDVVAHLNHWILHDIECIEALKEGRVPIWYPDVEAFNAIGVEKRKGLSWEQLYDEFITQGDKLVNLYETLSNELWNKRFWEDKEETPVAFLQEDIDHWQNEHLPQLEVKNL